MASKSELRAFHSDPAIKEKYLERVRAHRLADELIKGKYWENGKGCAVGCTIHSDKHKDYESELGIPSRLAHLEDCLFEELPNKLAMTWPERFLEAIPVGKDLSDVWPRFAIFLLTDASQCASRHSQGDVIAQAYRDELNGLDVDRTTLSDDAYAAATYISYFTINDAYNSYAADDATIEDAKNRSYIRQSEKLLELLAERITPPRRRSIVDGVNIQFNELLDYIEYLEATLKESNRRLRNLEQATGDYSDGT